MDEQVDGTTLRDVPETTLWTLHNRASEAARPDRRLDDPLAVMLRQRIEHPYQRTFGKPSQSHPLRALCFDAAMWEFLAEHPGGTVVSLGEGLETGFWRLADAGVHWVSVDLPEIISLRERLLPAEPRVRNVAASALDRSWFDAADAAGPDVLVSAQGLLMYFEPADVFALITDCARRFPGGRMIFDSIPPVLSRRTLRGWRLTPDYTAPRMPWGITVSELAELSRRLPGVATVTDLRLPKGRGMWGWPAPLIARVVTHRPAITLLTFAEAGTGDLSR